MSATEYDPYSRTCPSRDLLNQIGDLWTVLTVGALAEGPLRFKDLAQRVDGISMKMLTKTLRNLERDGLLTRTQYPQIPPRVEYELTTVGHNLVGPLNELQKWAAAHADEILESRTQHELAT